MVSGLRLGQAGDRREVLVGVLVVEQAARQTRARVFMPTPGILVVWKSLPRWMRKDPTPASLSPSTSTRPQDLGEDLDLLVVEDAPAHKRRRHRLRVYEVGVADRGVARRLLPG